MDARNEKNGPKLQKAGKPKVKICDFEKIKHIQKDFGKDRCGLCDLDKRIIWIHNKQPVKPINTRGVILHHEIAHLMLHDLGVTLKSPEKFCDLYALVKAPLPSLTDIERIMRESLFFSGKIDWLKLLRLAASDLKLSEGLKVARKIKRYIRAK